MVRDNPLRKLPGDTSGIPLLRLAMTGLSISIARNILVVKRSLFDELGPFQGLNFEPQRYLGALLSRGNNFFLPRAAAEHDPTHKQIIPYAIIAHGDRVLRYVRGKKAGEQRLVAKGSVGIGGHMNDSDESLFAWDEEAYRAG